MIMRTIICLSLALMLALTSQAMAVARGASAATGQMEICSGTSAVTVYVDADGAPTTAPHICPDCMVIAVGCAASLSITAGGAVTPAILSLEETAQVLAAARRQGPQTRAPPLFV
jgi:hypothetical protein